VIVKDKNQGRWRIALDETEDIGTARKVKDNLNAEGHEAILIEPGLSDELYG
jgi:hypothetical protein